MKKALLFIQILIVAVNSLASFKLGPDHLIQYPANRQGDLYDNDINELLYKETLAEIARAAEDTRQHNNEDFSEDYYELNPEDYDLSEHTAYHRDMETPSHSALGGGYQYVQEEGQQYLQPDGLKQNSQKLKNDDELPAYCEPPNPCPVGYKSPAECDPRPYEEFTADYSKYYQEIQDCMCDDDHNNCRNHVNKKSDGQFMKNLETSKNHDAFSAVVAKKSPRMKRDVYHQQLEKNRKHHLNPYLQGEPINHVAKKSVPV